MKEEIEPLSEYTMNAARESIEEYRYSRDYPAKAGAMSALAIILYDDAVRARARLALLESVLAEAKRECIMTPFCAAKIDATDAAQENGK